MATIESLNTSISKMSDEELTTHIMEIRKRRRIRPDAKTRKKSAPAKTGRKPKKAPRQQDLFAMAEGMTTAKKAALAALLMGVKK